jgi:hypothetical protein
MALLKAAIAVDIEGSALRGISRTRAYCKLSIDNQLTTALVLFFTHNAQRQVHGVLCVVVVFLLVILK